VSQQLQTWQKYRDFLLYPTKIDAKYYGYLSYSDDDDDDDNNNNNNNNNVAISGAEMWLKKKLTGL
jgi:hypothetical protein